MVLSADERRTLENWVRRRSTAQGLALRARIVLACADGGSNVVVAARLRVNYKTVSRWRSRFLQKRLGGLTDDPRPGVARTITDAQVEDVVVRTLRPVGERGRVQRGRETPDPGPGTHRPRAADAARRARAAQLRLRLARHHRPVRRPGHRHRKGHQQAVGPAHGHRFPQLPGPDRPRGRIRPGSPRHLRQPLHPQGPRRAEMAAGQPRFVLHFTPTYSSWINQVPVGSPRSSAAASTAASSAPSKTSPPRCRNGSSSGTTPPSPSNGPRPPTRSSTRYAATATESHDQLTSRWRIRGSGAASQDRHMNDPGPSPSANKER